MVSKPVSLIPEKYTAALSLKGFNVYKLPYPINRSFSLGRRNFYKIVLSKGHTTVAWRDQVSEQKGNYMFFANPRSPHSVEHHSGKNVSYACIFTDEFFSGRGRTKLLHNSPLFRADLMPLIKLTNDQASFMTSVYEKMLSVSVNEYEMRSEWIKSCIELIIHEAVSVQPQITSRGNAATRITNLFVELLEKQFPIENIGSPLRLRTAHDFADKLSVHVNYLNRSVKSVTGKSTTTHIEERIVSEAKGLLQQTDWSVADIAYSLGFEYPTYFNNYFKRVSGSIPKEIRRKKV